MTSGAIGWLVDAVLCAVAIGIYIAGLLHDTRIHDTHGGSS